MRPDSSFREALREILLDFSVITDGETGHLYFQPPESVKMKYPAIVYQLSTVPVQHADNKPYRIRKKYSVTVIDKNPDSAIPKKVLELPTVKFDRFFTSDNLNHWVFTIQDIP